jgi:predicted GIY-YIG superfamily endonuclease
MQGIGKRFVYVLRSQSNPARHYVGATSDVANRLEWHNFGPSGHTREDRPWQPVVVVEFANERTALKFERYLKSGSGRAFAARHFNPDESAPPASRGRNHTAVGR